MTKEFYSERDLDQLGIYSKAHRARLQKAGKFPKPTIQFGPSGKRLYARETIDALKALASKREAASA
jgi:hypothetical protein